MQTARGGGGGVRGDRHQDTQDIRRELEMEGREKKETQEELGE